MAQLSLRNIIPRSNHDRGSLFFTLWSIVTIYLFETIVVLRKLFVSSSPSTNTDSADQDSTVTSPIYYFHQVCGVWIICNILGNLWLIIYTDTSTSLVILSAVLKPGYSYCSSCEDNRPARAYHCMECNRCILRRDHHCTFVGKCVGLMNHRYFIMLLLHLSFGLLYANILNWDYIIDLMHGLSLTTVFTLVMPIPAWLLGFAQGLTFVKSFMCSQCILSWLFVTFMLLMHVPNLLRNQTTHEQVTAVSQYNIGARENIRQLFGERWWATWLWPWVHSPIPCDGVTYPEKASAGNISHTKVI